MGVLLACVALFGWGIGDFLIQRTARSVGVWQGLFFTGIFGLLMLTPFALPEVLQLRWDAVPLLGLLSLVVICTAYCSFTALRQGKIAVVEPILGLELPVTILLSLTLAAERIEPHQLALMFLVFLGILLAMTRRRVSKKEILEKGALLALVAALCVAATNFLVGISSQTLSPLVTLWFARVALIVAGITFLAIRGDLGSLLPGLRRHPTLLVSQSLVDTTAWVGFAFATTLIPIAIATTISENYIVLATLLGLYVNKERLQKHQIAGIVLAIGGVLILTL